MSGSVPRGFKLPRKQSSTLTEAELRLMNVLWSLGRATVHQLVDALPDDLPLAYNTVLTTIRILENKGFVKHLKVGGAHVYLPLVGRQEATRFEIRNLLGRFFRNSHEALVLNILEDDALESEELKRLRQLIERSKGK